MTRTLELALIANGRIGLLVDAEATVVWGCYPALDGDPMFCALLDTAPPPDARGMFAVQMTDAVAFEQSYVANTAVLVTTITDASGSVVEITDCVPRFRQYGRVFQPVRWYGGSGGSPAVRGSRCACGRPRTTVPKSPRSRWAATTSATSVPRTRCGSPPTHRPPRSWRNGRSSSRMR